MDQAKDLSYGKELTKLMTESLRVNTFQNYNIFDGTKRTKSKEFAEDKSNVAIMMIFLFDRAENT